MGKATEIKDDELVRRLLKHGAAVLAHGVLCIDTGIDHERTEYVNAHEELMRRLTQRAELMRENDRLQNWIDDLQAGMYINCVHCGHQYGPDDEVPASMAEILKKHVEQCPEHPMSKLKRNLELSDKMISKLQGQIDRLGNENDKLKSAATELLLKLDEVLIDSQFNSLFVMAKVHGNEYSGVQFADEPKNLAKLLGITLKSS